MATAHTAGPWQQDKYGRVLAANGESVLFGSVTIVGRNTAEVTANDRLIAAAPDLLAALQAILPSYAKYSSTEVYAATSRYAESVANADMIRAAIAKATGVAA